MVASAADEARAAARVAAEEGFPTVAVLAPRDDVGQIMADAFAEEAAARGLVVARVGTYDPTATELEPDIKEFLDLDPARNDRLAAHLRKHGKKGWQSFSPDVDFSLLYIPDTHDRASLVAAFLPYLGVELRTIDFPDLDMLARKHGGRIPQIVQLLGSGGWRHPGLLTRGGEVVEGAMIVDVCAGAADVGMSGEVAALLRERTGSEPGRVALEAYDAAQLVLAARERADGRDQGSIRERLRVALTKGSVDDGACGAGAVTADGAVDRAPVLLVVEDGELVLGSW
jgi:ABC-type branched-subunit amino acid transport system substrate-binding protein